MEASLVEQLAASGHHAFRIFNLAKPGHTSRDSAIKYAALEGARFALVVEYDGINDVRFNNAPPDIFRGDYGHGRWYEIVNAMAPYHRHARAALPYTLRYLLLRAKQVMTRSSYVPQTQPRPEWTPYAREARSVGSFEANLTAMLSLARARGDRMMLMTFATHVPDTYSYDAFVTQRLDYVVHISPIELWGRLNDVAAAIGKQNVMVRRVAAAHPGAILVDQAALMASAGEQGPLYNDICHLTVAGSAIFARHILEAMPWPRPTSRK